MPADYVGDQWYMKRGDQCRRKAERDARDAKRRPIYENGANPRDGPGLIPMDPGGQFPASLKKTRWSIEKIEGLIREKIIQRCKRASREYVQAYILFGRPSKGMSKAAFNEKLGLLGLQLTDGELQALMDRYDSNRSGKIDVEELFANIMPRDYPVKPWNLIRAEEQFEEPGSPKGGRSKRRSKRRSGSGSGSKGKSGRGRSRGRAMFTYDDFKEKLVALGYTLTEEEVQNMYAKYDHDGKGYTAFHDFVATMSG